MGPLDYICDIKQFILTDIFIFEFYTSSNYSSAIHSCQFDAITASSHVRQLLLVDLVYVLATQYKYTSNTVVVSKYSSWWLAWWLGAGGSVGLVLTKPDQTTKEMHMQT